MKRYLPILFLFISAAAYSQNWERVKTDSIVSIELPKGYTKQDTAGQQTFTAKTIYGNIQVNIVPDNPKKTPDIEKKKHLLKYYDNYVKNILKSTRGKVTNEVDTTLGDLHVKDFTVEVEDANGKLVRSFRILHENCATYTFQFMYNGMQGEVAGPERDKFFNSVKISNDPVITSQFTAESVTNTKKSNGMLWYIIGGAAGLLIIVLLVYFLRKKG